MKKIALLLLLGVSTISFASVVPVDEAAVRKTDVLRPDATKMKMMVKAKTLSNSVGMDSIPELQRYNNTVTMDNVKAIENMSRLMQDDPDRLMQQLAGSNSKVNFVVDRRKMGTQDVVDRYVASPETDDPAVKLGGLNTPELLGSFEGARASKEEMMAMHQDALKQIEEVGHQHLGQKFAPIQMPMTAEEIKERGVDTRRLPKDWEKTLEKAEKNRKLYQEQEARKKKEAAANKAGTNEQQGNQVANQQKQVTAAQKNVQSAKTRRPLRK